MRGRLNRGKNCWEDGVVHPVAEETGTENYPEVKTAVSTKHRKWSFTNFIVSKEEDKLILRTCINRNIILPLNIIYIVKTRSDDKSNYIICVTLEYHLHQIISLRSDEDQNKSQLRSYTIWTFDIRATWFIISLIFICSDSSNLLRSRKNIFFRENIITQPEFPLKQSTSSPTVARLLQWTEPSPLRSDWFFRSLTVQVTTNNSIKIILSNYYNYSQNLYILPFNQFI